MVGRKPYTRSRTVTPCPDTLWFTGESGVLLLHVERPPTLMGLVNHKSAPEGAADIHVFQPVDHLARAVIRQQGVDDNQGETEFSRAKLQVADLETVGRGKHEKRADFVTRTNRQQDQNLEP